MKEHDEISKLHAKEMVVIEAKMVENEAKMKVN